MKNKNEWPEFKAVFGWPDEFKTDQSGGC